MNNKKQETLSICIATWNSAKFISACLDSILKQTIWMKKDFVHFKIGINIVDNGSQDDTVDIIKGNYPFVHLLKNVNNLGYCRGYNQAIQMQKSDWVLIVNADVVLEPDFLEKLFIKAEQSSNKVASLSGKVLKIGTIVDEGGLSSTEKSDVLDTCGLVVKKSRHVQNIGEGEKDLGQYDELENIFGPCGVCVLYRREALDSLETNGQFLDEDFFAYQDDFDMAYRLQLLGWQALFVPTAKCYHFRSAKIHEMNPWKFWKIIKARKAKSGLINYHSYKNHLFVMLKNEIPENFWRHFIFIAWFEFKKFIFLTFFQFDFKTLGGLGTFFKLFRKMRIKRKNIMSRRKVTAKYIREWFK